MDIKVDYIEDLLWQEGIEFELITIGEDTKLSILGLREIIYVSSIWPDDEGNMIFDSEDIYVYIGNEFFGQLGCSDEYSFLAELNKILENYR